MEGLSSENTSSSSSSISKSSRSINVVVGDSKRSSNTSTAIEFAASMISGGISGIISKSLAAPIDRVKLLLQTQKLNDQLELDRSFRFKGPLDCAYKVYKTQGILSFWRGNVSTSLTQSTYRYSLTRHLQILF